MMMSRVYFSRITFLFCSHEVKWTKTTFSPPWKQERTNADMFTVTDANNTRLAIVPCRDDQKDVPFYHRSLTSDEAADCKGDHSSA
jgi:hypothetical protein